MSQSGYEIRWGILQEARNMLVEQYHAAQENENSRAQYENRPPLAVPFPTFTQVRLLAEEMYDFVQRK